MGKYVVPDLAWNPSLGSVDIPMEQTKKEKSP